jgi:hypothetical protein
MRVLGLDEIVESGDQDGEGDGEDRTQENEVDRAPHFNPLGSRARHQDQDRLGQKSRCLQ